VSALASNQEKLLLALARQGVEFVVVGGVAAQIHGWQGATLDLDIAVLVEDANVERLNVALATVAAKQIGIGGLGTAFETRYGRLEIVRRADGIGRYEDWKRSSVIHQVADDAAISVAAPADILRSKEAAGREKDLAALPQMTEDFRRSGALDED
jgi:hypothetical protein